MSISSGSVYGLLVADADIPAPRVCHRGPRRALRLEGRPYRLRLSGGRLGTGLIVRTALLETRGARSGGPGGGDQDLFFVFAGRRRRAVGRRKGPIRVGEVALPAITEVAAIAIDEMLATRRMPCEAGVRLTTGGGPAGGDGGLALVMDLVPAPLTGDAVLTEAPVFVEADAAPVLDQKLLDAEVSTERVRFTLRDRDDVHGFDLDRGSVLVDGL